MVANSLPQRYRKMVQGPKKILPASIHHQRGFHWNEILRDESGTAHTLILQRKLLLIKNRFEKRKSKTPQSIDHYATIYMQLAARMADETARRFAELKMKVDWNELFARFLYANRKQIPTLVRARIRKIFFQNLREYYPKK